MKTLLVALLLLVGTAAHAQPAFDTAGRDALAWRPDHRHAADVVSTVLVAGALAAPCISERTSDGAWRCLRAEGLRVGIGVAAAELVKRVVHRTRPDGLDDKSFFSEHTTLACAATLHTRAWAVCPAVGYLRVAANRHWITDVGTGAAVGGLLAYGWR